MLPLISVVTVVYNGVDTIQQTIESVISQAYINFEYIIIDGNSTDGTVDIINSYSDHINYWISEPDLGIYHAMNKAIDILSGEWVIFMNSGDSFYDEQVLDKIFNSSIDIGKYDVIFGGHEVVYNSKFTRVQEPHPIHNLWKGMTFCHQSSFVKSNLLIKYKFDINNVICADYEFFYLVYELKKNFYNSNVIIARVSSSGLSDNNRIRVYCAYWKIARRYNNIFLISAFYSMKIIDIIIRKIIKKFLPESLTNIIRTMK